MVPDKAGLTLDRRAGTASSAPLDRAALSPIAFTRRAPEVSGESRRTSPRS